MLHHSPYLHLLFFPRSFCPHHLISPFFSYSTLPCITSTSVFILVITFLDYLAYLYLFAPLTALLCFSFVWVLAFNWFQYHFIAMALFFLPSASTSTLQLPWFNFWDALCSSMPHALHVPLNHFLVFCLTHYYSCYNFSGHPSLAQK